MYGLKKFLIEIICSLILIYIGILPSYHYKSVSNVLYNNIKLYNRINKNISVLYIDKTNESFILSLDNNLKHGLKTIYRRCIIIMGHSGFGPNALFNNLEYLNENDILIIKDNKYKKIYKIYEIKYFEKGKEISLTDSLEYLYLITCDKKDLNKALLISSKIIKSVEK